MDLFPLPDEPANTNTDLAALIKKYPEYDATYLGIHMRQDFSNVKKFFIDAWKAYAVYADKNFLKEFQTRFFTERAWEIYLFKILSDKGFQTQRQSKKKPNPDLKLQKLSRTIFIEAVVAGKGTGQNEVETLSDVLSTVESGTIVTRGGHIDDSNHPKVQRILSVLREKTANYHRNHFKVVDNNDAYFIAVSGAKIDGNMMSDGLILEATKGINPALHYPLMKDGSLGPPYQTTRKHITNSNGAILDLAVFEKDEYKDISGVIFSGNDFINAILQDLSQEIVIVHNPHAREDKKIPVSIFSGLKQIVIEPTIWKYV